MIEISRHRPNGFIYVLPNGRPLQATKSETANGAAAIAMMMDIPRGGHIEELYPEDEHATALTGHKGI